MLFREARHILLREVDHKLLGHGVGEPRAEELTLLVLRFLVTLSVSYLLMAGMICMGIWFPVRKAVKMAPAEALHYE